MAGPFKHISFAVVFVVGAGAAVAQSTHLLYDSPLDPKADVNLDGMISFPEARNLVPKLTVEQFTFLDFSGDGLLDAPEIIEAIAEGVLPAAES